MFYSIAQHPVVAPFPSVDKIGSVYHEEWRSKVNHKSCTSAAIGGTGRTTTTSRTDHCVAAAVFSIHSQLRDDGAKAFRSHSSSKGKDSRQHNNKVANHVL